MQNKEISILYVINNIQVCEVVIAYTLRRISIPSKKIIGRSKAYAQINCNLTIKFDNFDLNYIVVL